MYEGLVCRVVLGITIGGAIQAGSIMKRNISVFLRAETVDQDTTPVEANMGLPGSA